MQLSKLTGPLAFGTLTYGWVVFVLKLKRLEAGS
jgi:hypothetical protein